MMNRSNRLGFLTLAGMLVLLVLSCKPNYPDSVFNPNYDPGTSPSLSDITPADSTWAGFQTITIQGSNFAPNDFKTENTVFFNSTMCDILQSTPTSITIKSPLVTGDSVQVRVGITDAEQFSNSLYYKMKPAVQSIGNLEASTVVSAICTEPGTDNIWISTSANSLEQWDKNGKKLNSLTWAFLKAEALRFGSNGTLYAGVSVGRVKSIVAIDTSDGSYTSYAQLNKTPNDIDFDADENIWVAAESQIMVVSSADASVQTALVMPGELTSICVTGNTLMVAGAQKVWQATISGTTMGDTSLVTTLADQTIASDATISSIELASGGNVYIGTDATDPILMLSGGTNYSTLYPDLMHPTITTMSWAYGPYILAIRQWTASGAQTSDVLKIDVRELGGM